MNNVPINVLLEFAMQNNFSDGVASEIFRKLDNMADTCSYNQSFLNHFLILCLQSGKYDHDLIQHLKYKYLNHNTDETENENNVTNGTSVIQWVGTDTSSGEIVEISEAADAGNIS